MKEPKNHRCPICNIKIDWNKLPNRNIFRGKCPNCDMKFTYMNGVIFSDPKFTKE